MGLEKRGWDPIVALVHGPTTNDSVGYKAAHPQLHTVTIDGSAMTMGARVREVMRTIRRVQPDFYIPLTVIDAHDAVCALKVNNAFAGQYVLSLHGNLPQQIADATLFQPFADLSVNPGALTCRLVEWTGMPKTHVFHAPNGTELHKLRTSSDPQRPLRLAYVGRLTDEDKRVMDIVGLVTALDAMSQNYHLDIVGSGPCEEHLRSRIKSPSVTFHGFINSDRLHSEFYPQWDVLLMFSQSEAFGISLIEAMAHGVVPVSSTFTGSSSEGFLIEKETARLFPIGDMAACAEIVRQLNSDRASLASLARRSHQYVSTNYPWKRCIDDWEVALKGSEHLPSRSKPKAIPRQLDEGNSLASRIPLLPPVLSDYYYQLKHRLCGIPESMKHGEEWPFHTNCFDAAALAEIQALTVKMDQRCAA